MVCQALRGLLKVQGGYVSGDWRIAIDKCLGSTEGRNLLLLHYFGPRALIRILTSGPTWLYQSHGRFSITAILLRFNSSDTRLGLTK